MHTKNYQSYFDALKLTLVYPFKYDCISGKYLYPKLEFNLQKNIAQGNGIARATGFFNYCTRKIDCVVKEVALQNNSYYMTEINDDAEKMFDHLYIELQAALLLLAGTGLQGFTEWQCANMTNRTNKLVIDIFVALLDYKCGLPQGNGFSVEVEIANLYAIMLLMWRNMDHINPSNGISPFESPRHGFPLITGGILKPIASLAYVDDAK